ncbi:MAG TPA: hypothetical protein VIF57_17760 [Polyangia bacterium]|jgi:hypothetical protein
MRFARIALFALFACGACTHDYDALTGNSGAGGATARGGAGGSAHGGAGGTAQAGRGGSIAGAGGSSVAGAGGSVGPAGSGGSAGAQGGSAGTASSAGAGGRGGAGGTAGAGGSGPTCAAGEVMCPGGACVNTNNNTLNCGGCGQVCPGTCMNGVCMTATGAGGHGGTTGTAGASGTSGSTCGATFDVQANGFVTAPAQGGACWHGYAFAGGDTGSTISPPDFGSCGSPCMLKMTGTIGAATAANSYAGNAYLAFNIGQEATGSTATQIVPKGTSLTFTFAASIGSLPLRAQLNAGSAFWCYMITGASPVTIPYSAFNTACWDNSGTAYAKQPIQSVGFSVPGGATATSGVSVTLTSVKEN